jgi:ankyrin repeat protein
VCGGQGHAAVVEELLRAGAAVEGKDRKYGGTPLTLAAMHGQVDVVRYECVGYRTALVSACRLNKV